MRKSFVAGSFYPENKKELLKMISNSIDQADIETLVEDIKGFVAPHAGYIYSGRIAAYTYKALYYYSKKHDIDSFVIIGPNHSGYGPLISISNEDWQTPLGIFKNDRELTKSIASYGIEIDETAHEEEHSIEVQMPFIQYLFDKPKGSFICMMDQSNYSSELVSHAIYEASRSLHRNIVVIASSDFNHYESAEIAKKKDMPAIKALEELNVMKFN